MAINVEKWDKDATILSTLIGKTIIDVDYDGKYSAPITLKLSDGRSITISAVGDDMSYTTVED